MHTISDKLDDFIFGFELMVRALYTHGRLMSAKDELDEQVQHWFLFDMLLNGQ